MSVIIHGMHKPAKCEWCQFRLWNLKGELFCRITAKKAGYGCPLVLVTAHGRLIDADALYEVVKKRTRNWNGGWSDIECVLTGNDIKNAPTVIEAEEAET